MISILFVIYILIGLVYIGTVLADSADEFTDSKKGPLVMAVLTSILFWPAIMIMVALD